MSQNKQPQYSLLLGPFVRKNQQKYAKDPKISAKLEGLTLDDLKVTNVQKQADGVRVADIEIVGKDLTGTGQKWKSVTVHDSKVLSATNTEALADKAAAQTQAEPGVYVIGSGADAKFVVVISDGTADDQAPDVAIGILLSALNYDVDADDVNAENGVITVDGLTIYGQVDYVTGKAAASIIEPDDEPIDLNS